MIRYFRTERHQNTIRLDNKVRVKFDPVDHRVGVLATEDEAIINGFLERMKQGVGLETEITETDYQDLLKKKAGSKTLRPGYQWREELGADRVAAETSSSPVRSQGVAGAAVDRGGVAQIVTPAPGTAPVVKAPRVGRRPRAATAPVVDTAPAII